METHKLESQKNHKIRSMIIIGLVVSSGLGGLYYYIAYVPHCSMQGIGEYSCDRFASNLEQQQICAYNLQLETAMSGEKVTPQLAELLWEFCAK